MLILENGKILYRHEFGHVVFSRFTKRYRADRGKTPNELVHPNLKIAEEGFAEWIKTIIDSYGDGNQVNKDLAQRVFTPTTTLLFESVKQGYYGDIPDSRLWDAALLNYVHRSYGKNFVIDLIEYYNRCFCRHYVKGKILWIKRKIDPKTKKELATRYEDFQTRVQKEFKIDLETLSQDALAWYQTGIVTGNWEVKTPSEKLIGREEQR